MGDQPTQSQWQAVQLRRRRCQRRKAMHYKLKHHGDVLRWTRIRYCYARDRGFTMGTTGQLRTQPATKAEAIAAWRVQKRAERLTQGPQFERPPEVAWDEL